VLPRLLDRTTPRSPASAYTWARAAASPSHLGETGTRGMNDHPPQADSESDRRRGGADVGPVRYQISVRGRLTERLGSAFAGMTLEPGEGQTALVGEIRDQSHLYGILDLVRCLGLELVSVQPFADRASRRPERGNSGHGLAGVSAPRPGHRLPPG
jgi:hypothetical protein